MNHDPLYALCIQAQEQPMEGWDFSAFDGRMESAPLPWDYRGIVLHYLRPEHRLLDMGTGGGEFLLGLGHTHRLTAVTEGYPPNLSLCQEKLRPLGIDVKPVADDNALDFQDGAFDLIINRHEDLSAREVYRCLKPGGLFITQQVGGGNNHDLALRLIPDCAPSAPEHTLENNARLLEEAGFEIVRREKAYPYVRFFDIAALVRFARIIEWEFPGFSVDICFDQLIELQKALEKTGYVGGTEHRFLIVAQKSRRNQTNSLYL